MTTPVTTSVGIQNPNRGFTVWSSTEIFTGPSGTGQYVPNVDDIVWDWTMGVQHVIAVDYTTGLSTLKAWSPPASGTDLTDVDVLLGAGPGLVSESYRIYLDQSVMPHTFAMDRRVHIYGTTAQYVKIFLGADISTKGQVISQMYDQSGTFLGENIPLELVAMDTVNNMAVKAPVVGYTTQNLTDGEVVTAVVYDSTGGAVSIQTFIVKNSAFIRTTDASAKYIVNIAVQTPFLSSSDPKLISYPINMPVSALNLMGVVTYSDGSKITLPVDGTKFSMYGLENYIATIQGQQLDLVLSYTLSPGEYNYIGTPSPNKHISIPYKATTTQADGAYSIKLFVAPVWQDALNGYRLEYYMYNLDREQVYLVTNLVTMGSDSRAFNPLQYGTVQHIGVGINLSQVDPSFANYRHVQEFDITLLRQGSDQTGDNWTVGYTPGQTPPYGVGVKAAVTYVEVGDWHLDVSCGLTNQTDWLNQTFYAAQPLFDPGSETQAPTPNFFALVYGAERLEVPISQWANTATMTSTFVEGTVLYVEFFKRNAETDLQLGVAPMIVHLQQSAPPA